ncbi:MAG: YqaA family protein [Dehalococcoidia bacterium]
MADPRADDLVTTLSDPAGESPIAVATEVVETVIAERRQLWRREYTVLLLVAFLLTGFAFAFYVLGADPSQLRRYGYLGVFLIPLIGSATFILPMPGLAVIATGGALLDPVFGIPAWIVVGLLAGLGETLGEITGYAAGYGGRAVFQNRPFMATLERWMHKQGSLVMFGMSVLPNPFFDVAGVIAGAVQMPLWKFFIAVLLGKVIKSLYIAGAGALGISVIDRWVG